MRYTLTLVLLIISFLACSITPEERAEKAVNDYLRNSLNDLSSYQPVDFSGFKKISLPLSVDKNYSELLLDSAFQNKLMLSDKQNSNDEIARLDSIHLKTVIDSLHLLKVSDITREGYKISHRYRSKNQDNTFILKSDTFYLDMHFKVIAR
jgi:hypothetical protein